MPRHASHIFSYSVSLPVLAGEVWFISPLPEPGQAFDLIITERMRQMQFCMISEGGLYKAGGFCPIPGTPTLESRAAMEAVLLPQDHHAVRKPNYSTGREHMKKPKTTKIERGMPGQHLVAPDTTLEEGDSRYYLTVTTGENCPIKPFLNSRCKETMG